MMQPVELGISTSNFKMIWWLEAASKIRVILDDFESKL